MTNLAICFAPPGEELKWDCWETLMRSCSLSCWSKFSNCFRPASTICCCCGRKDLKKASITPQSTSLFTCCLWMACCIWAGETWASWDCKILWRFCSAWGIWTDWLDPAPAGALTPVADPSPASCIAFQTHRYAQSLNFFDLYFFTFRIFLQQTDLREHQLYSKVIPLLKRLSAIPILFCNQSKEEFVLEATPVATDEAFPAPPTGDGWRSGLPDRIPFITKPYISHRMRVVTVLGPFFFGNPKNRKRKSIKFRMIFTILRLSWGKTYSKYAESITFGYIKYQNSFLDQLQKCECFCSKLL